MAPSYGNCEGVYLWRVESGNYNGVSLDGKSYDYSEKYGEFCPFDYSN
ncbi:MAG: DUF1326 domain-containing protein [SAR202 cluster bacterium]|nr:DUF1326 domain-containing protein [SAR202 cluster bacterium]